MSHKLHRLLDSVYNTPHLILEASLHPIVDYLEARSKGNFNKFMILDEAEPEQEPVEDPTEIEGIGEILVDGTLTYRPVYGLCGPSGVSYQGILEQAEELIESGVDTILMTFSSPGGQAAHCFSTCLELRQMADDAGVKLVSYIDEMAASAALALSVICDEVYIHPSATTGSIGCVCAILDQSKALEMIGLKPIYIASTPGKTPFNNDGSFSDNFLADLQEDVTALGNQFAVHVSTFTGIPFEDIVAMDAKMYRADQALEKGLVNGVMDHTQFLAYLAQSRGTNDA